MNRAARVFTDWFVRIYPDPTRPLVVFAGTGNNGGDGLAVARMLDQAQYSAKVIICDFGSRHSADYESQLASLSEFSGLSAVVFHSFETFQEAYGDELAKNAVVIDALFGSGLSRPLEDDWAQMIDYLNNSRNEIVSIDVPSGLFCDSFSADNQVIKAARTFSFQTPKKAFFFPEHAPFSGEWTYDSIGLHPDFEQLTQTDFHYLTIRDATSLWKPRTKFSHKGSFGHALIIAGSKGKIGAAVLATRACLRGGAGLVTVHTPACGNFVLQTAVPEAMNSIDKGTDFWTELPDLQGISSIGIGPGISRAVETAAVLKQLILESRIPLVLDADALNLISENPELLDQLPENSILTPHPKEFERLFGKTTDSFQRNDLQRKMSLDRRIYIILKGAHTAITCPDGRCWFNSTGNPGMATGGSGDVLTGILTALLAQGYSQESSCLLGVFLHGLSGDLAALERSQEALVAGDLIDFLGKAWLELSWFRSSGV